MFLHFVDVLLDKEKVIKISAIEEITFFRVDDDNPILLLSYIQMGELLEAHLMYSIDGLLGEINYVIEEGKGVTKRIGQVSKH